MRAMFWLSLGSWCGSRESVPRRWNWRGENSWQSAQSEVLEARVFLSAGEIDTSFGGGDGTLVSKFQTGADDLNSGADVAVQADGKIIVAGTTATGFSDAEKSESSDSTPMARWMRRLVRRVSG